MDLLDDGSLEGSPAWDAGVTVSQACGASRPLNHARHLYELIRELRPKKVLELGTNVGISGAYIGTALQENGEGARLVTMDASPGRHRVAQDLFERVGLSNADFILGNFDDTFDRAIKEQGPFDFVFIDGNHSRDPTLYYANSVCQNSPGPVYILFDDIRWSEGMAEAWKQFQNDSQMVAALDLYSMSLCVMRKDFTGKPSVSKPLLYAFG